MRTDDTLLRLLVDTVLHDNRDISLAQNHDRNRVAVAVIRAVEVYLGEMGVWA